MTNEPLDRTCRAKGRTGSLLGWGLSVLLALAACPAPLNAEDWPQFRGANSSGISSNSKPLPVKFSNTENVRWSASVGEGVGGAVVAAGRAFVSGMTAKETVSLFAFDAETGHKLWQRDWSTGRCRKYTDQQPRQLNPRRRCRSRLFLFQLAGHAGGRCRERAKTFGGDRSLFRSSSSSGAPGMSPVLYTEQDPDAVFCQDDDLSPALYALDRATGKQLWKDERLDMAVNYSHPVVNKVDGRDEIVVAGTGLLIGYDPQTGKRRWHAKTLLRNIKTTPVCADGVIYISLQSSGIANQWLAAVDQAETGNKDGKVDKAEIQAYVGKEPVPESFFKRTFDRGDLNHDGVLEGAEFDMAFLHPDNFAGATFTSTGEAAADEFILAVRGGGAGDVTDSHVLWKHPTKHTDHIVSPLVSDGRMLLVKGGGISTVFDTEDGTTAARPEAGGQRRRLLCFSRCRRRQDLPGRRERHGRGPEERPQLRRACRERRRRQHRRHARHCRWRTVYSDSRPTTVRRAAECRRGGDRIRISTGLLGPI